MIKYISVAADGAMWIWDEPEYAEDHLLGYGLSAGEQAAIHEVELEPADLNDANVFIVYNECGLEFVKSPDERDKEYDNIIDAVYVVKNYLRAWAYKLELTTFPIDGQSIFS